MMVGIISYRPSIVWEKNMGDMSYNLVKTKTLTLLLFSESVFIMISHVNNL